MEQSVVDMKLGLLVRAVCVVHCLLLLLLAWKSHAIMTPPVARRDEQRVVYVGNIARQLPDWKFPLQSEGSTEPLVDPPVAIPDPYGWMRDETRKNPVVLAHLEAENAYTEAGQAHLAPLRQTLYQEMVALMRETDYNTPRPYKDYFYYSRTFQGQAYARYCRARRDARDMNVPNIAWDGSADTPILAKEETTLDVNELAQGHEYCDVGSVEDSPSQNLLAYSVDYAGDEIYRLFVKDLVSGEIVNHDEGLEMDGSVEWGSDDSTLFYVKMDSAMRPYQVYKRTLGGESQTDELLYQEDDELFEVGVSKSADERYLFIEAASIEATEVHYLDLQNPSAKLQCVAKRRPKVLYNVEHQKGQWWIQSNVGGLPNLALWKCAVGPNCEDSWELVKDANGEVLFDGGYTASLAGFSVYASHVVLSGRTGGLPRIWFAGLDKETGTNVLSCTMLEFPEEAYDVGEGRNFEYETDRVAVAYDSLVTPTLMLEISLNDPTDRKVLKETEVPGYDKTKYDCERVTALSRDGKTEIPVSLVYRKDVMKAHKTTGDALPVVLYGYGAYGSCEEATFSTSTLTLLNRGVVFATAHIRGGGENGRQWYEEPNGAKYLCKKNSFNDFVDIARWLVEKRRLTSTDKLACMGASAGGLLVGATINQAPELFKAAILDVPFVDIMATMADASLPLVVNEWEEWGNPNEKKFFQYMLEYSPMQNVKEVKYPSCLICGGLHDIRVQYFEPAKLAATLRHDQDSKKSGPVYLKIDMSSGHFSASDRYKFLKEYAFQYAFLLDELGAASGGKECSTAKQ